MRRTILSLAIIAMSLLLFAQTPNSFNYQAVVRKADGTILQNSNVSFRFTVLKTSTTGSSLYVETQSATTNQYGLVTLTIGEGSVVSGDFTTIDWGADAHFLKVDMDINGGSSFTDMSTQQLVAVPYAMHASTVTHSDNDSTNEYQDLSKSGSTISLSDGGGDVILDDDDATNELQALSKSGATISLSDGGGSVDLDDDDATNELQTLSKAGINLTLSDGGGTYSVADNDNNSSNELQTISKTGINLSLSDGGGTISLADNDNSTSNELQTLSKTGNNVTLSNGGGTISVADNDNNSSNELQDLDLSGDSLSLTSSSVSVALNGLNHWTKNPNDEIYYTADGVGIGTSNPSNIHMLDITSNNSRESAMRIYNTVNKSSGSVSSNVFTATRNSSNTGGFTNLDLSTVYNPASGSGDVRGIFNYVSASPDNSATNSYLGMYNYITRSDSGSGSTFGTYNYLYHAGNDGSMFGDFNYVSLVGENPDQLTGEYTDAYRIGAGTGQVIGSNVIARRTNASVGNTYGYRAVVQASPKTNGYDAVGNLTEMTTSPDNASSMETYGSRTIINRSDSGSGASYGSYLDLNHTGNDGAVYGLLYDIDITGGSPDYAFGQRTDIYNPGVGTLYGEYVYAKRGSVGGVTYGTCTLVEASPSSGGAYSAYGNYLTMYASPTTGQLTYGMYQDINKGGTGSGYTRGYYMDYDHTGGTGIAYGFDIDIDRSTTGTTYGMDMDVNRTGTANGATIHGIDVDIDNDGSGSTYAGQFEARRGTAGNSASGTIYGLTGRGFNYGSSNSSTYGTRGYAYDNLTGTSRYGYGIYGYAYGVYSTGTSRMYGVYGYAGGSADVEYAGYFSGSVYTTGSYLPSDSKLKTDISLSKSSLERIKKLKVYSYNYNTEKFAHMALPEGMQTGFLASELGAEFPELTTETAQPPLDEEEIAQMEEDGIPVPESAREEVAFTAVNYAGLVPHLTKAIQEQQEIIDAQAAELEAQAALNDQQAQEMEAMQQKMAEMEALLKQVLEAQN